MNQHHEDEPPVGFSFSLREWLSEPVLTKLDIVIQMLDVLGDNVVATFEEAFADLSNVTDEMADALAASEAANAALREAVANGDTAQLEALAAQAAAHTATVEALTARLRGLGTDPENPVPDTDPLPPVEDPQPTDQPVE